MRLCRSLHITGSSRKGYHRLQKQFIDFCLEFDLDPLTVSEDELCKAAAYFTLGHTVNSMDGFMSALQDMYTTAGVGPLPRGPKFKLFRRGLMRLFGAADEVVRTRALGMDELVRILKSLNLYDVDDVSFGAEMCVAFLLCLRTEDHTDGRMRWGDVYMQVDGSVEFSLAPGKSVHRYRRVAVEAKSGVLSVAQWLQRLAALLPSSAVQPGLPVFVGVKQVVGGGVRYPPRSRSAFIAKFKSKVQSVLGFSPALYAGYSLRRGGVTELLSQGVPVPMVKRHVGWVATSDAVMTYYDHSGRAQMRMPTAAMGRGLLL